MVISKKTYNEYVNHWKDPYSDHTIRLSGPSYKSLYFTRVLHRLYGDSADKLTYVSNKFMGKFKKTLDKSSCQG